MKNLLGPILGFRSSTATTWNCCVLHVFRDLGGVPPALKWTQGGSSKTTPGARIYTHGASEVWVYEIPAKLGARESTVAYELADGTGAASFTVPAKATMPRMAYCSCNGFSDPKIARDLADPIERWTHLAAQHAGEPFHMLVMGGDQVYADQMWAKIPELEEWTHKFRWNQTRAGFTQDMEARVRQHYFDLYTVNWARTGPAEMLASIPTVMMWDDHDITDGWGSHPDNLQLPNPKLRGGGVLPGVFTVAKEFFEAFQLRVKPGVERDGTITTGGKALTSLHTVGPVALLVLDLRSERTRHQIIGDDSWGQIKTALEKLPADGSVQHLLVMSSIPIVYPSGGILNNLASLIPWDPVSDPQDDLIDHWSHGSHQSEREKVVRFLFKISKDKKIRVTVLSGDVHVAAQGVIESDRGAVVSQNSNVISQLISSGIVHPPSGGPIVLNALNMLAGTSQELYRGVEGWLAEFWSGGPRLLPKRNWLSLVPLEDGSLRAQWHVESVETRLTKDIGPCR